jgi:hypothetical protein
MALVDTRHYHTGALSRPRADTTVSYNELDKV